MSTNENLNEIGENHGLAKPEHERPERKNKSFWQRLPLILVLAGFILILFWVVISAYRAQRAARSIASRQDEVKALMENGLLQADPVELEKLVLSTRQDVLDLKSASEPFVRLGPLLSWVPRFGSLLAAGPDLLQMADAGSEAAVYLIKGMQPLFTLVQQNESNPGSLLPSSIDALQAAKPQLALASLSTDRVSEARSRIKKIEDFPEPFYGLMMQFDNAWPLAEDAVTISQVLPSIMGADSPRTYLIMAQNEDELRATGGFISGAGIISLDDGQVTSISFTDTYRIDDWKHKPYDLPPEPYTEFMGMDIFLFRDSNYWPNFPTSAEQAMQLYTYGQNVPLDGVIAIDQRFLQLLLKATGPVSVPELERVIRAADVIEQVRSEWGPGANDNGNSKNWIGQRKAFMGPLANALKNKLEGDLITIDQVALARAIKQGIEQGHLQIYMRDPNIQKALSKAGWDGNVNANPGHDFLLVIDTNLGFNKVNAAVKRSFDYHIMLDDDDSGRGELAIRYDHTAPAKNEPCLHGTEYGNDTQYEDLIIDCYWNYLRVYVPEGTNLIEASTHPLSSNQLLSQREWAGEARSFYDQTVPSTVTFDNFLLIKPGQQQDVRFYYDLPQIVTKLPNGNKLYQLLIAKQAGTDGETVKITIELPLGRKFIHSNLEAAQVDGQVIILESKLDADLLINVEYR